MGWVEKNTGVDVTPIEIKEVSNLADAVTDGLSDVNKFVKEEIPGGWATVAALAGAYYYGMPGFGAEGLAASDAAFVAADAAQLASQGLSTSQIASTLSYAGVPSGIATTAATYAGMGLPEAEILSSIYTPVGAAPIDDIMGGFNASQGGGFDMVGNPDILGGSSSQALWNTTSPTQLAKSVGSIGNELLGGVAKNPLQAMNLVGGLMAPQQPGVNPQNQQAGATQAQGVDYSGLLALMQQKAQQNSLLGTQFQPQSINLTSLLG